jgi:hypothetical protein
MSYIFLFIEHQQEKKKEKIFRWVLISDENKSKETKQILGF